MDSILDIRTLSVVIGFTLLSLGICLFYYSTSNKTYAGFGKWALGLILNGLGFVLIGFRYFLPLFFSIFAANIFIYSGSALLYFGFKTFTGQKANIYLHIAIVSFLSLILHPYFTYLSPNVSARIIISSYGIALYCSLCTMTIFHDVKIEIGKLNKVLMVTSLLMTLIFIARGSYPVLSGAILNDYMKGAVFNEIVLLTTIILAILFVVGLMELNSQKLENELGKEQQNFEESEERYKRLVDQSLQGLAIIKKDPVRFAFVNKPMAHITGYSQQELLDLEIDGIKSIIHPEDWDGFYHRLNDRFAGKALSSTYECRIIHKNGNVRWIEIYASLFTYKNKPTIHGTFWDITERKKAEEALALQAYFERLITEISAEFLLLDLDEIDNGIKRALEAVGKFSGADRAYIFLFQENNQKVDNTHEWCAKGIESQKENLKNIDLASNLPWFSTHLNRWEIVSIPSVSALPPEAGVERGLFQRMGTRSLVVAPMVLRNKLIGFIGFDAVLKKRNWTDNHLVALRLMGEVFTNTIERKRVEARLRESEERWQFALEGADEGVWDWDVEKNKVYFSIQWKAMLGYDEQDISGTFNEWEKRVHPEDLLMARHNLDRHFKGETRFYQCEHRMRCKDGAYKWILTRGKVVDWTEKGNPRRVIGTHADISRQKEAQAEREKLIAELQDALNQVKTLSGLLPICSICKNIRDDSGYWNKLEAYIYEHSEVQFSHGICPDCAKKYYAEFLDE